MRDCVNTHGITLVPKTISGHLFPKKISGSPDFTSEPGDDSAPFTAHASPISSLHVFSLLTCL